MNVYGLLSVIVTYIQTTLNLVLCSNDKVDSVKVHL